MGISEDLETINYHFVEKIADNMETFGVSKTIGIVLGTIYMNRKPMTLDELAEETGLSKMRMSQVVREMNELNIAKRVFIKGSRKDHIQVEDDYYQTFISLFTSNWRKAIQKSRNFEEKRRKDLTNLERVELQTEELVNEKNKLENELIEWSEYYDWINRLIEFFDSGEIFKHVPINEKENIYEWQINYYECGNRCRRYNG